MTSNGPVKLFILPGLDGGTSLSQEFVKNLPPTLTPINLELPLSRSCGLGDLMDWAGERLSTEQSFFLLGQSFTTHLAIRLASQHRVAKLILVTPIFRRPRRAVALMNFVPTFMLGFSPPRFVIRSLLLGVGAPPELVDRFLTSVRFLPTDVLIERLREVSRLMTESDLPTIPCSTLCLHAGQDRLLLGEIPRSDSERMRHVVIAGPHLLLARCPAEAAEEVVSFLEQS